MRRPDPAVVEALGALLAHRHVGREHAATWAALRSELAAEGLHVNAVRRLQEAAEALMDSGAPVVGLSSVGVFWAADAGDVAEAIVETERRARRMLTRRRRLRQTFERMLGQAGLRLGEGDAR